MRDIKITVPATTANIACAYDATGIALNLYNEFIFSFKSVEGVIFKNVEDRFNNKDNLVYTTFIHILDKYKIPEPNSFYLEVKTDIPVARGLGSSSTCIVAAILAANYYGHLNLDMEQIIVEACLLEGHPDNVVPALLGNMASGLLVNDKVIYQQVKVPHDFTFYAFVEPYETKTVDARAVLPTSLSYEQAIFNIQRSTLLLRAFENRYLYQLNDIIDDALHQPYRYSLIKRYYLIKPYYENDCFIARWISGSGSTLMALGLDELKELIQSIVSDLDKEIKLYQLKAVDVGARLEELD